MDVDGSSSPTWPSRFVSPGFASAANLAPTNEVADGAPRRFQGDGYDFRRPVVSSSSNSNVIDLTDEDAGPSSAEPSQSQRPSVRPARPPRFGREIIDVEEDGSETAEPPDSPEIQFVSSRRLDPPQRRNPTPYLEVDDEDEVEFLSENPLPESERRPRTRIQDLLEDPAFMVRAPHLRGSLERHEGETRRVRDAQIARMERMFAESRSRRTPRPLSAGPRPMVRIAPLRRDMPGHFHVGFIAPNLNFGAVGFNMGIGFVDEPEAPPPPPPTYDAPQAAPQGFTRSPQEEEFLVCPNCEDELCTGDSDQKRQVWLVKGCGHVCSIFIFGFLVHIIIHTNNHRSTVVNAWRTDTSAKKARKKGPRAPSRSKSAS